MRQSMTSSESKAKPLWLERVQDAVQGIQFGVVEIVVHNSQVVRIEKTEKVRLEISPS
jgi:hypothetical protein